MTMSEILEKRELPVLIQFSTDKIIPDEGKNRDGSPASFLIIATYEEHFIQGNYLLNGILKMLGQTDNILYSLLTHCVQMYHTDYIL